MVKCLTPVLALLLLAPCAAEAQEQQAAPQPVVVPAYPDSPDGLKRLLDYMRQTAQAGKEAEFRTLARSLAIPSYPRWFVSTFGGGQEYVLSAEYSESASDMETVLPQLLSSLPKEKKWKIDVWRVLSTEADAPLDLTLAALKRPMTFYRVNISRRKNEPLRLGYFVYVEGTFRLLGRMAVVAVAGPRALLLLRPGDFYEPARVIKHTFPRSNGRRGSGSSAANYWVIVDRDGKAHLASAVGADPKSAQAFADLLPRWQCAPAMLNGQPIETVILYTIQVTHSISMVEVP